MSRFIIFIFILNLIFIPNHAGESKMKSSKKVVEPNVPAKASGNDLNEMTLDLPTESPTKTSNKTSKNVPAEMTINASTEMPKNTTAKMPPKTVPAEMTLTTTDMEDLEDNMTDAASSIEALADDVLEEELVAEGSDTVSKGDKQSKKCAVKDVLVIMADHLKNLEENVRAIKKQMIATCPGFKDSSKATDPLKPKTSLNETTGNKTSQKDETETEGDAPEDESADDGGPVASTLPPIPEECTPPFQPVAGSCYFFLYSPPDWKSWGEANAYCQSIKGTLAAPKRFEELQEYLLENFSNVFWVGAKKSVDKKFKWLNGKEINNSDFRDGKPGKAAAKYCVYLEYFSGYKAVNHYCGEKFSFVCEEKM